MKIKKALLFVLMCSLIGSFAIAATVQGRVIDKDSNPLPNVEVNLASGTLMVPMTANTDAEGKFKFEQVAADQYKLNIVSQTHGSIIVIFRIFADGEVANYDLFAWKEAPPSEELKSGFERAREKFTAQQYAAALEDINACIEKFPNVYYLYRAKGSILLASEKEKEGIEEYKKALELNPYDLDTNKALAEYYRNKKDVENWQKRLFVILYSEPTEPENYMLMGFTYRFQRKLDKAFENYEKALKLDNELGTKSAEAYFWLGGKDIKNKNYAAAQDKFKKFVKIMPGHYLAPKAKAYIKAIAKRLAQEGNK